MDDTKKQDSNAHDEQKLEIMPHDCKETQDFGMIWDLMEDYWSPKQGITVHQPDTPERPMEHKMELC